MKSRRSLRGAQGTDAELEGIWQDLAEIEGGIDEGTTLNDYITADDRVLTDGIMSLEEIAASTSAVPDNSDGEEEEEAERPAVSNSEAHQALETLRRYIEMNVEDPAVLRMCDKLDDVIAGKRAREMRQMKLTDFMQK